MTPALPVALDLGDLVLISGTVGEFSGMTQLSARNMAVVASGVASLAAIMATFMTAGVVRAGAGGSATVLEAAEGMIVSIATDLKAAELHDLDRCGERHVPWGGRLTQFIQDHAFDGAGCDAHLPDAASQCSTKSGPTTAPTMRSPVRAAPLRPASRSRRRKDQGNDVHAVEAVGWMALESCDGG